ncbi:hypothetical protein HK099_003062, partial [Clydaea vesicula]
YKPLKPRNHPRYKPYRDVTILVPTIDTGDEIKLALKSWLLSKPFEIIFITIPSKKKDLESLALSLDSQSSVIKVITVKKANKRNQMIAGINEVKTPIIVFADDDVIWPPTMLEWITAPFEDRKCGGVDCEEEEEEGNSFKDKNIYENFDLKTGSEDQLRVEEMGDKANFREKLNFKMDDEEFEYVDYQLVIDDDDES